jgi:glycosyltransferase involved in cell wall biosynthesis
MAALYAAADVYVTPSLQENLPNTIAEAMSVGTPCVGFEVGGIPEMIDHRQNGYVARYKDVADLAQGVAWVLDNDLRHAARQKASVSYNPDTVAQQYISLYEE